MDETILLKYAQPVLIGVGLIVVLNLWNIIQVILSSRKDSYSKIETSVEKLTESNIRLVVKVEQLEKDINGLGRLFKGLRDE